MMESVEPRGGASAATILLRVVVGVAFLGLVVRLWHLQVLEANYYRTWSETNRYSYDVIPPTRGVIYSRAGPSKEALLTSNSPIFVVSLIPGSLPRGGEGLIYERLSQLISVPPSVMSEKVEARRQEGQYFSAVPIRYNIDRIAALKIEESHQDLPGVVVSVGSTRKYQEGELFAHLIGHTSLISPTLLSPAEYRRRLKDEGYSQNDRIGASGLEEQYESVLRGRPGRRATEVDASGRPVREISVIPPQAGNNLILTLDLELQQFVAQALKEGVKESPSGVAIVSDPRTGEILSLVSLPTFDNNVFTDEARDDELAALLKDTSQPFFHRATAGLYPPGSTFKLISAVGALQEGVANRDTVIESRGVMYVPHDLYPQVRQPFPEWISTGLGKLNFISAIANSSNIYFFYLGGGYEAEGFAGLRVDRIARYARLFGYGAPTGIDLPDEASGTIPDEDWKLRRFGERWFKGDTYNMAIGQGYVQATPLQVANVTNAIANGGTLLKPRLIREIVNADGNSVALMRPQIIRTTEIDPSYLRTVVEGMEAGYTIGRLLRDYRIPGLRVAGKTGTGEFSGEINAKGELPTHGWFTGFAPADDPKIAVTVFVERGSGSKDAAPIAARIFRHYFKIPEDAQPEPLPPLPGLPQPTARPAATPGTAGQTQPAPPLSSGTVEPISTPTTEPEHNLTPGPTQPARPTVVRTAAPPVPTVETRPAAPTPAPATPTPATSAPNGRAATPTPSGGQSPPFGPPER